MIYKNKMLLPERATISLSERPTFSNLATRVATVEFGPGMLLFAASLLALKLSLLPVWTSQLGPPDCKLEPKLAQTHFYYGRRHKHS